MLDPKGQEFYEKEVDNIQNQLYQDYIRQLLSRNCCFVVALIALIILLVIILNLMQVY